MVESQRGKALSVEVRRIDDEGPERVAPYTTSRYSRITSKKHVPREPLNITYVDENGLIYTASYRCPPRSELAVESICIYGTFLIAPSRHACLQGWRGGFPSPECARFSRTIIKTY